VVINTLVAELKGLTQLMPEPRMGHDPEPVTIFVLKIHLNVII